MSLLNFGFTQEKKGHGVAEDQCKRSADGPAAADEVQTKNKKYDTQRKRLFLPQWKTKWLWVVYDEEKGVMFCQTCRKYPSLADKSSPLFSGTSNFRVDLVKSHQRSREHEACGMRIQHESKERATTELKGRIYSSIQKGLETVNLSFEKLQPTAPGPSLACANFDGCNVMLGQRGGVISQIKEVIPTALEIHCVAHKLERAVLDASKSCPQM